MLFLYILCSFFSFTSDKVIASSSGDGIIIPLLQIIIDERSSISATIGNSLASVKLLSSISSLVNLSPKYILLVKFLLLVVKHSPSIFTSILS